MGCAQSKESKIEKSQIIAPEKIFQLEKEVSGNPDNTSLRNNLIVSYIKNGNYEKARNLLSKTISYNPNDVNANYLLGLICMRQGIPEEAETYYEKVIKLNPYHSEAIFNLASIAQHNNNYEKAKKLYQKVLEINPNDGDAHYNLALIYDKRFFEYENAIYHYKRCIDLYKTNNLKQDLVVLIKNRIDELKNLKKLG